MYRSHTTHTNEIILVIDCQVPPAVWVQPSVSFPTVGDDSWLLVDVALHDVQECCCITLFSGQIVRTERHSALMSQIKNNGLG